MRAWLALALAAALALGQVCPAQAKSAPKPQAEPAKPQAVTLEQVQIYPDQARLRLVAVLSGQTSRRWRLLPLEKSGDKTRLFYLDLDQTKPGASLPDEMTLTDPRARSLRVAMFKPTVLRLVLAVAKGRQCQVSYLDNPFRVVVDIPGTGPAKAKPETKPEVKSEAKAAQALPPASRKLASQLVEQLGLTVRAVMVDPGHGGKDPGAIGVGGLMEKDVTLRLAKLLEPRLEEMGFKVLHTRDKDQTVPLKSRPLMANAQKADLYISIHCNASRDRKTSGMEIYTLNLASTPEEARLAARENATDMGRISDMQKALDELMHSSKMCESKDFAQQCREATLKRVLKGPAPKDRGLHEAPLFVLLGAKMPAILVEVGYVTNPAEAAKLRDPEYLERLAHGLADGILAYKHRVERFAGKQ